MVSDHRTTGGGHATAGGVEYQARVTAWVAVGMLAGSGVSAWRLRSGTHIEYFRCETETPVDDLNVGLSDGGIAYIQAKRQLAIEKSLASPFFSVIDQFVRQYRSKASTKENGPTRSFDPSRDRLLLVVGRDTPASITKDAA